MRGLDASALVMSTGEAEGGAVAAAAAAADGVGRIAALGGGFAALEVGHAVEKGYEVGRDFLSPDFAMGLRGGAFEAGAHALGLSREALAAAGFALAAGAAGSSFDFVTFEIFRDFAQTLSLFFSSIGATVKSATGPAVAALTEAERGAAAVMAGAQGFFGNIAQVTSVDFGSVARSPAVEIAMYYGIAAAGLVLVLVSCRIMGEVNTISPDVIRDGHVSAAAVSVDSTSQGARV